MRKRKEGKKKGNFFCSVKPFDSFSIMESSDENKKKAELIREAINQLIEERRNNKGKKQGDEETILLSRLLSQLDSLEKKDTHTTSMLKCPLEKEEPSALPSETRDCDAKDVGMDEIVKELRTVKRQNVITHCLLSVLTIVTAVWQFSEASLLLNMKEKVSHPMKAVGDMVAGTFKWKRKKPAVEAPPLPPIGVPELPHMDLPCLTFDGAGSKE